MCNLGIPQMFMGGIGIGWIFMIIFWALIIWAIIAIFRALAGGSMHDGHCKNCNRDKEYYRDKDYGARNYKRDTMWHMGARDDEALRTLRDRYARGEIDREEYEMRRRDLMG